MSGSQIFRQILSPAMRLAVGFAFCVLFFACHKTLSIGSDSIAWNGTVLSPQQEVLNPSDSLLQAWGFPKVEPLPNRMVEVAPQGAGVIKLLEFSTDIQAYGAFQRMATPMELTDGFASRDGKAFFHKGKWCGWINENLQKDSLQASLILPGKESWGSLPQVFSSILQQGRIPHSERVLADRFLGLESPRPVFSAQLDCHGDFAWIYASPGMPSKFSTDIRRRNGFQIDSNAVNPIVIADSNAEEPIRLDFSALGMVGVEGCFDTSLTISWIKTQKMALKSLKLEP